MTSGGRILWYAVAMCKMTKTSWQTGNLKMNEQLENPSRTCYVRGEHMGRRCSDCWDWRIAKLDASRKSQKTKNPLWDGNPPSREMISWENLTAIGKSFDLKNKKMTQKIGNNFGLCKDTSFLFIKLNREFNSSAKRRISFYLQYLK